MAYNHKNKRLLIRNVCAIVQQHYEAGNLSRCYKRVWWQHVYPIYPICYRTFLSYINARPGPRQPAVTQQTLF